MLWMASAVYGKQTKNEIKWCHNCEIHIGITYISRRSERNIHDWTAKRMRNSHTHEQVKSFCSESGRRVLPHGFFPSSPQNSAPHNWNGSHRQHYLQGRKAGSSFGSGSVTGYCCRSKRIYHCRMASYQHT